ncbi:MAG: four helix bundle protein [Actinomycetota bacterium]|nr:four helix bundle protein [Actinomycetota bacterium]
MQDFRKLRAWQQGMDVAERAYAAGRTFSDDERYGLRSQIQRAGVSIPSNIAEGCGRRSGREFVRFLRIAYGSACEVETQALLAMRIEIGDQTVLQQLLIDVEDVRRMLAGLIVSVLAEDGGR